MSMQIFLQSGNAKLSPIGAGPYGENLEEMRLTAFALVELLARERAGTFDGVGGDFWIGSDRVLDTAKQLFQLAQQRAASLADGSFAFKSMLAYSGSYRTEGAKIIIDVDIAWDESWVGTEQVRT